MTMNSMTSIVLPVLFLAAPLLALYRTRIRRVRTARVQHVFIYPVKGLRGLELYAIESETRGLSFDRRFVIVTSTGDFITQRAYPIMATIETHVDFDKKRLVLKHGDRLGKHETVSVGGFEEEGKARVTVRVWDDVVENAVDQGEEMGNWLSGIIGVEGLRLVYMGKEAKRVVKGFEDCEVSFADAFPVLVTSVASLEDLNKRCAGEEIPMNRFRPNVVVDGLYPWTEDVVGMQLVFPSGQILKMVKPCDRCKVTTTDQFSGQVSASGEPLKTLRTFRMLYDYSAVYFGMNALAMCEGKEVAVGKVDVKWV